MKEKTAAFQVSNEITHCGRSEGSLRSGFGALVVRFQLNAGFGFLIVHAAFQRLPIRDQISGLRQIWRPSSARNRFRLADNVKLPIGSDFTDKNRLAEMVVRE